MIRLFEEQSQILQGGLKQKIQHTGSSQERGDQVVFNPVLPELISMTISSDEDSNQGILKL